MSYELERRLCSCGLHWLACAGSPDVLCPDCALSGVALAARASLHRQKSRDYYWSHRERRLAYNQTYYQSHRERILANQRSRCQSRREKRRGVSIR